MRLCHFILIRWFDSDPRQAIPDSAEGQDSRKRTASSSFFCTFVAVLCSRSISSRARFSDALSRSSARSATSRCFSRSRENLSPAAISSRSRAASAAWTRASSASSACRCAWQRAMRWCLASLQLPARYSPPSRARAACRHGASIRVNQRDLPIGQRFQLSLGLLSMALIQAKYSPCVLAK
ncbi:hypothetical protein DR64_7870 [Paraburkholderia xenovorans LB400]|nr:hypothetical protein DR64_7870 [Paraburkholderia xenovorans LB400]